MLAAHPIQNFLYNSGEPPSSYHAGERGGEKERERERERERKGRRWRRNHVFGPCSLGSEERGLCKMAQERVRPAPQCPLLRGGWLRAGGARCAFACSRMRVALVDVHWAHPCRFSSLKSWLEATRTFSLQGSSRNGGSPLVGFLGVLGSSWAVLSSWALLGASWGLPGGLFGLLCCPARPEGNPGGSLGRPGGSEHHGPPCRRQREPGPQRLQFQTRRNRFGFPKKHS